MIETTGIDHVVLHVNDVQRAKKFYTEVLGMTPYREDDGQVFLHAGRQGVALFRKEGETPLTTGNDLNHDERTMLTELADKAASAYNKLDYDQLRQRIAELEGELTSATAKRATPADGLHS